MFTIGTNLLWNSSYKLIQGSIRASISIIKKLRQTEERNELDELDLVPLLTVIKEHIRGSNNSAILTFLQETTQQLYRELEELEEETQLHRQRWFSTWRSANTECHLVNIRMYERRLRKRWQLYIDVYKRIPPLIRDDHTG